MKNREKSKNKKKKKKKKNTALKTFQKSTPKKTAPTTPRREKENTPRKIIETETPKKARILVDSSNCLLQKVNLIDVNHNSQNHFFIEICKTYSVIKQSSISIFYSFTDLLNPISHYHIFSKDTDDFLCHKIPENKRCTYHFCNTVKVIFFIFILFLFLFLFLFINFILFFIFYFFIFILFLFYFYFLFS